MTNSSLKMIKSIHFKVQLPSTFV